MHLNQIRWIKNGDEEKNLDLIKVAMMTMDVKSEVVVIAGVRMMINETAVKLPKLNGSDDRKRRNTSN
jgi:hypothetical protein